MQNITIGRYADPDSTGYAGWVEGLREDGTRWILWLDESGSPACYWGQRSADGSVVGDPTTLTAS